MLQRLRRVVLLSLLPVFAHAESPPSTAPQDLPVRVLDTVVVSGKVPGPGLWKVSKGEHVMWLLCTVSPLPKRMEWESGPVEATIAASQELLVTPTASIRAKGAALGGLFLIPSLLKARNNPDGLLLKDVLPAEDYARFSALKQRYLGRDRGIEKRRPIFAAGKLQDEALDDEDLVGAFMIEKAARKAAKKHDVPITEPNVELVIEDAKKALKDLRTTSLDDLDCFRRTLTRLENEIDSLKLRANAWALGEIGILQSLPYTDTFFSCVNAVFETKLAREHGLGDIDARLAEAWLTAADTALEKNASTFALLPLSMMLREDGYLARLEKRGYRVEAPVAESTAEDGVAEAAAGAPPWR